MRYQVNSGPVISEVIDGEAVIINLTTGNYYSLNESGAAVWSSLERSATVDEIATRLASRYDASPADVRSAVTDLLAELEQEDLIVAADGTGASISVLEEPQSERLPFQPPRLEKHTDMQDLILLDPVHEVGDQGWPHAKDEAASA
jgi:coenzyme PQQ synthesis protein D (PqqD)